MPLDGHSRGVARDPAALRAFRDRWSAEIESALDRTLPAPEAPPRRLHEAMRHSVFAGGKRVRPVLLLAAGELLGAVPRELLPAAAAIEFIHTFSLVHDDLPALDDDDLRRGRATLHRRYDEATAILAGDALVTLALGVLSNEPSEAGFELRNRAVALATEAIGTAGMIGGQMADLEAERSWPAEAATALDDIHRRKTGALLTLALRLGGLYAEAAESVDAALVELGDHIGLMFQIADDVLDAEGSAESLGKSPGKDAATRKLTSVELHGVATSRRRLDRLAGEALETLRALPGDTAVLESLIHYLVNRER